MLHIKLPKKRVAHALMARAAMIDGLTQNKDEHRFMSTAIHQWKEEAIRHRMMAEATQVSTGDVYVSMELWSQIKGYYDV